MLRKTNRGICLIFLAAVFLLCGCSAEDEPALAEAQLQEEAPEDSETRGDKEAPEKNTVTVHVCGQVASPGVYELPEGSRLYEAIQAAGGLGEEAAPEGLNQAALAEDGQQIYVPSVTELSEGTQAAPAAAGQEDGKVNLNTAGKEELMTLTGIGEAKAAAILKYREEKGSFESIEELMEINGIKEGVFEKIRDEIKV